MDNSKLEDLLVKSIKSSNRTTHAVRAFVRFLFIQLSFITAAVLAWQIGLQFPDESTCTVIGCSPHGFWIFVVVILVLLGIILASRAGWHELSLSEVPGAPLSPGDSSNAKKDVEYSDLDKVQGETDKGQSRLRKWIDE